MVGAVLHRPAMAQADTARARRDSARATFPARPPVDSTLRDTLFKRDSTRPPAPSRADTIKAPFTRAPLPAPIEIGMRNRWNRDELFATGALTLQDLLDRVPGITGLRSGWIAAPMVSAYLGDVRRVRLFYDGLELDELDPRTGGVFDMSQIPIWTLEELRIERGASEVRVYMRSWRVDRTTPSTRTDIATGDQQTNAYRGFFGRRYRHGEGFQLAAQQYGTTPQLRGAPSSDQIAMLGRLGYARGRWSIDAFATRTSRNRGLTSIQPIRGAGTLSDAGIPEIRSRRLDGYVRVGYGDPERSGLWLQALAGASGYTIDKDSGFVVDPATKDTIFNRDTSVARTQYVAAGGVTFGALRVTGEERLRVFGGRTLSTPAARGELVTGPLAVSAYAEARGVDSVARLEAAARLTPLSFVSVSGAVGRTNERSDRTGGAARSANYARAEGGVRLLGLWFLGGVVRRDSVVLAAPIVFDTVLVAVREGPATGVTAAIRGRIYHALQADLSAIRWNDSTGFYRPRYQTRSELFLATNWLSRFPSGNFGILASAMHEYRSATLYPVLEGGAPSAVRVPDSRILTFRLELRIVSAVAWYQFRNIRGEQYQLVPGYLMPRITQLYGVRWEFWN